MAYLALHSENTHGVPKCTSQPVELALWVGSALLNLLYFHLPTNMCDGVPARPDMEIEGVIRLHQQAKTLLITHLFSYLRNPSAHKRKLPESGSQAFLWWALHDAFLFQSYILAKIVIRLEDSSQSSIVHAQKDIEQNIDGEEIFCEPAWRI